MSLWSRISNALFGERLNSEIEDELQLHIEEAIALGLDPDQARRTFGSILRQREMSHSIRVAGWLESLLADTRFGWRQLRRNKVTALAAVASLALGMGSCVAAFRLIDALLWRPLPVAHADRLFALTRQVIGFDGKPVEAEYWATQEFDLMRDAVEGQANLIAASYSERSDLTFASDSLAFSQLHLAGCVGGNDGRDLLVSDLKNDLGQQTGKSDLSDAPDELVAAAHRAEAFTRSLGGGRRF
jgi:hypothetical protein